VRPRSRRLISVSLGLLWNAAGEDMRRRSFLKGIAACVLQLVLLRGWPWRAAAATKALIRRVRPSGPGWPKPETWQKLKDAVGGNLIEVQPLFAGCSADPKSASCLEAQQDRRNPFWIADQPAGTETSGWLDAWTPAPSAYAVAARDAADVAAAVNFAREHKLRLVVKGGAHSYQGTSNCADSLLIWTRKMNKVTLHDSFVGKGCEGKAAPVPAVTAEAGAVWIDLYQAVTTEAGRYVQGGGCTSVGVAGLIQSGGFGSLSKGFGTAASSLLEAEIVTADGTVRTVNARQDSDLFWALKGGGGGSWGVVTKVTLRTHDLPPFVGGAVGKIKAKSDGAYQELISRFVSFYRKALLNPHWGEQGILEPDNTLKLSMVMQGMTGPEAEEVWKPFFEWVKTSSQDYMIVEELRTGALEAKQWWQVGDKRPSLIRDPRDGVPKHHAWWRGDADQVGFFITGFDSVWLPVSLLEKEKQGRLVEALFASSRLNAVELHFNKGLAGASPDVVAAAKQTATNPLVADAFVLVIIANADKPAYPGLPGALVDKESGRKDARAVDQAIAELRKLVPHSGSYVSESNYFNKSWQEAFWGTNYPRLQAIKAKYDPDGLFFVHHGVGSETWSADGFTQLASNSEV
jgi:FAD/FMN-containing dehydrogenase